MGEPGFRDRVAGCVLGLALGDALGAPFESRRAKDVPDPIPALELPWRGGPPGSTTDDTAMAMNLVRSLVAQGSFDADDLVRRHVEWLLGGPPDVGTLTGKVLRRVADRLAAGDGRDASRLAEEAARAVWEERGPEVSAGNGSVMYCPPLGAAYAGMPEALEEFAPRLSGLTHHDRRCRTAVLAVALAVARLVRGAERAAAVATAIEGVAERNGGEELEYLVEAVGEGRPIDGPDQGFCLFATAAGLQAVLRGGSFEDELRRVIGLGGDTDTNGAVAGALLGSAVGLPGLPGGWLERLQDQASIRNDARALADLAATL